MDATNYYSVFPFVVVWKPPYTNGEKRQPCFNYNEAEKMATWFASINVPARIVRPLVQELDLKTGDLQ